MSEAAASINPRPGDPAEALAALRADLADIAGAEVRRFGHTLDFVAMNLVDPDDPDTMPASHGLDGGDDGIGLAGAGAPAISEFAVTEYAAALRMTTDAGKAFVGACMEARYRLPELCARVLAGQLPVGRVRRITDHTRELSAAAAAFVDRLLAPVAHSCSWAQLDRLVEEAICRFDPDAAEAKREAAADRRRFDVHTEDVSFEGTVFVDGEVDLQDALDLEHAIARGADELARLGCEEPLDVRRSIAAGDLARSQLGLDVDSDDAAAEPGVRPPPRPAPLRPLVVHVHLSEVAVRATGPGGGVAACEAIRGPISIDQVRNWCDNPEAQVTITPVIDLTEQIHVESYAVPDRLRAQTGLRDGTCVFPYCTRPAARCDCDHIVAHDQGGQTSTDGIARLCRRHHRAKTHGGFRYRRIGPAAYEWTTPHGYRIIRDHHGTHPAEDP